MDSPYAQHAAPSHMAPGIHISRPEYASVPQRTSDDDISIAKSTPRSRFEQVVGPGLGIQMQSIPSPKSPGNVYSQQQTPKSALFSPFAPNTPRPLYTRTPDTLYSFGSGISRARTDPMTERLIAHRATQSAQWKIHWRTPALMVFAFVAGVALALAQHFWYRFLHHRAVEDEDTKVRWVLYGRALAYLSKVSFGGCVVLVFRQRIWRTFRERALTVLSIDQLFGATDDPSLFVNWDTISNAPVAVAIAMVFWLIPLATIIFSPGALTFGDYPERTTITAMVPTLNFTAESYKDWRHPITYESGNGYKRSVMYYNTTDKLAETEGWFDYYDQPSAELKRIALLFGYNSIMNHSTNKLGARQASCGELYDCIYEQTFIAPGYKCDEVASGPGDNSRLAELGAPFDTSMLVPEGRKIYYAQVDIGDYKHPQDGKFKKGSGGVPEGDIPEDLGVFKHEPVLWIGLSVNSTERVTDDYPFKQNWTHRYDPSVLRCVLHEAEYTVNWNYSGPYFHEMAMVKYLDPVVDTEFPRHSNGTPDYDSNPVPAENYISPRNDVALYKKTAAYHAMGDVFRDFLRGSIEMEAPRPGPSYAVVDSPITRTRLVTSSSEPKGNFTQVLEDFYSDMVLSLFSAPEMLTVSQSEVTLHRTRSQSSFVFVPTRLWMCYAPVILVTLIILLFGIVTIFEDGTTFSTGFSRILVTTRNTTLDDISRGACLGNDPFPMELMHTRLKFGVLSDGNESEYTGFEGFQHCSFGVASEVAPIRKGAQYAGLTRRRRLGKVIEEKQEEEEE
jgi:hypothetical protein